MSVKRKFSIGISIVVVLLIAAPTALASHHWGSNAVDGNRRIVYIDYSSYGFLVSHANNVWNQGGKVSIVPENQGAGINGTLEWYNANRCDVAWVGLYTDGWAWWVLDKIELNQCFIDGGGLYEGQKVAAHELGHGLALGDHNNAECPADCLMYFNLGQPFNAPTGHDWGDYHFQWP